MNKVLSLCLLFVVLFTGCSSKQYFEPEDSSNFPKNSKDLESSIIDLNVDGATLENYSYISKKGIIKSSTKLGYSFINQIDETVLTADNNASVNIYSTKMDKTLSFEKNIISASINKNLLAFGSEDNSITLYDLDTNQILFKEYLEHSHVNNIKIANPVFLNSVVLYPTLDGKIIIVDIKNKSIIKTINLDPQSDVNNIIFLQI